MSKLTVTAGGVPVTGASSHQSGPNIDLRSERPMHRTLLGDLHCPGTLLVVERPVQSELAFDPIEQALFGLTFGTVLGVDARVAEPNGDAPDGPSFPSRIQRDGHGRSGAERRQQQIVGTGPAVGPTRGDGLVGREPVAPDGDLL